MRCEPRIREEVAGWEGSLNNREQIEMVPTSEFVDARRHPRYQLEVEMCVYPRNAAVVRGHSVDISETGISGILRDEVPMGAVVRLEFPLPTGKVDVHALVRYRNAFRYGFKFVETSSAGDAIGRTCRDLALEQSCPPAERD